MSNFVKHHLILAAWLCLPTISFAQEDEIAEAVATAPKAEAQDAKPAARPITVAVSLVDDNTVITGTLTDTTSIGIKTAFGVAELPLSEVAGLRLPRNDDTSTTVVMLNGDSITGATDLKFANVETTWGTARINGQNIASMLMVPGLTWQSVDVLGSKRWQLVETPRNQQPGTNPPGSRPGNLQTEPIRPSSGLPSIGQPVIGQPIRINN